MTTKQAIDWMTPDEIFVETDEPSGLFGANYVAEIAIDGVAPAIAYRHQ
jgi:hypothetical protein